MSVLKAYGRDVTNVFQIIGDKENDITKSIAWVLKKCPDFLVKLLGSLFGEVEVASIDQQEVVIHLVAGQSQEMEVV